MPSNVEIKARARDPLALRAAAARLCADAPARLQQEDTFFATPRGRLKLRVIASCASPASGADIPAPPPSAELIYYERANAHGPRESAYVITPVADVATMRETLSRALGITGVVRKARTLYLAEQTRIHLDEVETLGAFVELETVLRPNQSIDDGTRITEALMQTLGISRDDLVDCAYVDLLRDRSKIRVGTPSPRG